jgi:hypothetical protein
VATPDLDYQTGHEFFDLTKAAAFPIYGALAILNNAIRGNIRITYQTLGANFVLDRKVIYERLAQRVANLREIYWSQVVNKPSTYPVDKHDLLVEDDLIGLASMVAGVNDVATQSSENSLPKDVRDMAAHIADLDNPHQVTKADVGLGLVNNYAVASPSQAIDNSVGSKYMTPQGAAAAAVFYIPSASTSTAGKMLINTGTQDGDAEDDTKAVTADGLYRLMKDPAGNLLQDVFSNGDTYSQFTPYPLVFPRYWRGIVYPNLDALLTAIHTYVGVKSLAFDSVRGIIFFPTGVAAPSLQTYSNPGSYPTREGTTEDDTELPMRVPNV